MYFAPPFRSEEIARIRIGVAPDDPRKGGAKYILAPFRKSQLVAVDEAPVCTLLRLSDLKRLPGYASGLRRMIPGKAEQSTYWRRSASRSLWRWTRRQYVLCSAFQI